MLKHDFIFEFGMPDIYAPIGYFGSSYFGDDVLSPAPPAEPPPPPTGTRVSFSDAEFRAYQ